MKPGMVDEFRSLTASDGLGFDKNVKQLGHTIKSVEKLALMHLCFLSTGAVILTFWIFTDIVSASHFDAWSL